MTHEIHPPRKEVLRYLGCAGGTVDKATVANLEQAEREIHELAEPRYAYRIFELEDDGGRKKIRDVDLPLEGDDIQRHLADSARCVVMCVTIGNRIEEKIRYYSKADAAMSIVLDASASAAVEALADSVQEEIALVAEKGGLFPTTRFSPGYGDFPLSLQPRIIRVLDAGRRVGLAATDAFMLTPGKSVTAFIGLQKEVYKSTGTLCETCPAWETCKFRRKGLYCDKQAD